MSHKPHGKLHYAWIVCFACALMFFCTCGLSLNVYQIYQPFLCSERGFSQTQVSLLTTIRIFANMASLLVLNVFYKKLNLRKGLLVAGIISVTSYYLFSFAKEYWVFVIGQAMAGFGYGLSCMVPLSIVLERWFIKDRTLAVSIVCATSGLATIGIPGLITASIEKSGIGKTFLVEAIIMTVMIVISFLLMREDPKEVNLHPFGDSDEAAAVQEKSESDFVGLSRSQLIPVYVMVFLMGGICGTGWSCMSMLASTEGYSSTVMALAITLAGAALMGAKFLFGWLADRTSLYKTTIWFSYALILGGLLMVLSGISSVVLLSGCLIFGGAMAMITVGQVSWTADWVAPEKRNDLKRILSLCYTIGSMVTSIFPGIVADAIIARDAALTKYAYLPTYAWFTFASVVCLVIMWLTYRKLRRKKAGV